MSKIHFSVLLIFLTCCSSKDEQHFVEISRTIEIPIPSHALSTYICQYIYNRDSLVYYYGYNYLHHSIDIFNLSNQEYVKSVKLQKDGPNGIKGVNGFKVLSDSSILLANNSEIVWVNFSGEQYKSLNLLEIIDNSSLENVFIDFRSQNDLIYNHELDRLLVHIREKADYSSEQFFSNSIVAEINIDEQKILEKKIYFPPIFKDFFFGDLSYPIISSQNDINIISFPVTKTFYIRENENWEMVTPAENFKSVVTKPISKESFANNNSRIDYIYNSTYYGKMNYLFSENKFCRVHLYDYSEDGVGERRIEIFNTDFEIEYIYKLKNNHTINYFVVDNSIFLNRMNEKESYLIFDEVTL
jgi:hypothetical protein